MGFFGNSFDFDNNGFLDPMEQGAELGFLAQIMDSEKNEELLSAGLNSCDLENMGYFERLRALEDAGLDPSDYGL